MNVELSYKFSKLDNTHCFGLVFNEAENYETYIRWVWYYLGQSFIKIPKSVSLYPYKPWDGKILKVYKYATDASRQAYLIANRITKKLSK